MRTTPIRIGNFRGLRLAKKFLSLYGIRENNPLELEERAEGILIRPAGIVNNKLSLEEAYRDLAAEADEASEWSEWDATTADGIER